MRTTSFAGFAALAIAAAACATQDEPDIADVRALSGPNLPASPGQVHTRLDDCQQNHTQFSTWADVHVIAPRASAGMQFQVRLSSPSQRVVDLGLPQLAPYDGSCTALVDLFGGALLAVAPGGYKVEVCLDPSAPNTCGSQNFQVRAASEEPEPWMGTLVIRKFYDANEDGLPNDPAPGDTEPQWLEGWAMEIHPEILDYLVETSSPSTTSLEPGTYTVLERLPNESNWFHVTPRSHEVEIVAGETTEVEFGNACKASPGGHTLGWWQNKNGEAEMRTDLADDLAALNALHLKDLQGADRDFALDDYAGFRAWLKGAKGNPMAYMLSAQLATLVLSMRHGHTDGDVYVGLDGEDWLVAQDLVDRANALLADFDPAAPDANEAEEARIKDWIDAVNNGRSFTQPTPALCPFTF